MFSGTFTALVTPMTDDGAIDLRRLRDFVEFQIAAGISGLVPCGTTGETPTLSLEEQRDVIRTTVDQARGRVPVIAGAGANATAKAIANTALARECGADAVLQVAPYYNKPPQRGMIAHFRAIADASALPVVLYNVPGRTSSDLLPATLATLAEHPRIVGVKEASGSIARMQEVIARCPSDFVVLSGDDGITLPLIALGGRGVISVVSNVVPAQFSKLVRDALAGDLATAREAHYRLLPLIDQLFVEANPIAAKAAVAKLGFTADSVRSPLMPLADEHRARLDELLRQAGALS